MLFRHRHEHRHQEGSNGLNFNGEVSLTTLSEGTKAVMTRTSGGLGVVRRLTEMGLTPGCEIKLLFSDRLWVSRENFCPSTEGKLNAT